MRLSECCVRCATLSNRWAVCVQIVASIWASIFVRFASFMTMMYDSISLNSCCIIVPRLIKKEQFHCDNCGICSFLRYGILNYLKNDLENIGIVDLLQDVSGEKEKEIVQKCPRNVFDMEDFAGGKLISHSLTLRSTLQEPYLLKSILPKLLRSWKISVYESLLNYHDIWGLRQ
ncbi:hypothetical protein Droror1_Dr00016584 [Drosera rotundifolia]